MKPSRKILLLAVVTTGIITIWLAPGINQGKDAKYVRYYEDTDRLPQDGAITKLTHSDTTSKKKSKVYKKEVIEPRKSRKVEAKMFSRATHFEPVIENPDSLIQLVDVTDSLAVIQ